MGDLYGFVAVARASLVLLGLTIPFSLLALLLVRGLFKPSRHSGGSCTGVEGSDLVARRVSNPLSQPLFEMGRTVPLSLF